VKDVTVEGLTYMALEDGGVISCGTCVGRGVSVLCDAIRRLAGTSGMGCCVHTWHLSRLEETTFNSKLYYRTSSSTPWTPYSQEELTTMLLALREEPSK
jgi:hypothetical protein